MMTVAEGALLSTLSQEQMEYVSLGLTNNFGVVLHGDPEEGMVLESEFGMWIGIHATTITVMDVWEIAREMARSEDSQ